MTDLYQQAPGSKGYSPQDWEVVRRMAPGAMLLWVVPVEPDGEPLMTFEEWRQAVNPDGIDLQEAIDIYDLGVGEETP